MKCLFKCSRLGIPCLLPGTSNSLMKIQFFFDIVFFFQRITERINVLYPTGFDVFKYSNCAAHAQDIGMQDKPK